MEVGLRCQWINLELSLVVFLLIVLSDLIYIVSEEPKTSPLLDQPLHFVVINRPLLRTKRYLRVLLLTRIR